MSTPRGLLSSTLTGMSRSRLTKMCLSTNPSRRTSSGTESESIDLYHLEFLNHHTLNSIRLTRTDGEKSKLSLERANVSSWSYWSWIQKQGSKVGQEFSKKSYFKHLVEPFSVVLLFFHRSWVWESFESFYFFERKGKLIWQDADTSLKVISFDGYNN